MDTSLFKVGTLAKRTGLTVRTLHYYEEIGLLIPCRRSEKGYRLYGINEVQRLQKILSMQQLGFSLEEIRRLLDNEQVFLSHVLELHIERVEGQIQTQQKLLTRLKNLSESLSGGLEPSIEAFLETIKVTNMHEKYYTADQLEQLKQRGEALGEEGMRKAQLQWTELNNAFRREMENGTDPGDEKVQALVERMKELIRAFTGGNAEIEKSLGKMYQEEGAVNASQGMLDQKLFEYMGQAREISGG